MEYPLFLEKKLTKFRPIFHFIQTLLLQPSTISQSIGINMKPQSTIHFSWTIYSTLVFLLPGRNSIVLCFWSLKIKHLGSSNYQLVNHCNPLESYKNVLKCIVHCQGCLHLGLNHHGMHGMVNNIKNFIFNAYIFHKSTRKGLNKYSYHTEKPIMMQCDNVCNTN